MLHYFFYSFQLRLTGNHLPRRYLRARKFSPDEAAKQFFSTEEWRKVNNLEKVYESISVDRYEQTRKLVSSLSLLYHLEHKVTSSPP